MNLYLFIECLYFSERIHIFHLLIMNMMMNEWMHIKAHAPVWPSSCDSFTQRVFVNSFVVSTFLFVHVCPSSQELLIFWLMSLLQSSKHPTDTETSSVEKDSVFNVSEDVLTFYKDRLIVSHCLRRRPQCVPVVCVSWSPSVLLVTRWGRRDRNTPPSRRRQRRQLEEKVLKPPTVPDRQSDSRRLLR